MPACTHKTGPDTRWVEQAARPSHEPQTHPNRPSFSQHVCVQWHSGQAHAGRWLCATKGFEPMAAPSMLSHPEQPQLKSTPGSPRAVACVPAVMARVQRPTCKSLMGSPPHRVVHAGDVVIIRQVPGLGIAVRVTAHTPQTVLQQQQDRGSHRKQPRTVSNKLLVLSALGSQKRHHPLPPRQGGHPPHASQLAQARRTRCLVQPCSSTTQVGPGTRQALWLTAALDISPG